MAVMVNVHLVVLAHVTPVVLVPPDTRMDFIMNSKKINVGEIL